MSLDVDQDPPSSSDYSSDDSSDEDQGPVVYGGGNGVTSECPFKPDDFNCSYLRYARSSGQSSYNFLDRDSWNEHYKDLESTKLPLKVYSLRGNDDRENYGYLLGIYSNGDTGSHSSCAGAVYIPSDETNSPCIKSVAAAGEILARKSGYGGKIPNGWNSLGFVWDPSRPQHLLPIGRLRPGVNPDGKNNRKRSAPVCVQQPYDKKAKVVVPVSVPVAKKMKIDGIQRIFIDKNGVTMMEVSKINPDTGHIEHATISSDLVHNPSVTVCMFLHAFFGGSAPLFICPPYNRDQLSLTLNYWATHYNLEEEVDLVDQPFDSVLSVNSISYVPPQMPGQQPRAFMGVSFIEHGPLFKKHDFEYTETSFPVETGDSAQPPHRRIIDLVYRMLCRSFPEIISATDQFAKQHPFWPNCANRTSGEISTNSGSGKGGKGLF